MVCIKKHHRAAESYLWNVVGHVELLQHPQPIDTDGFHGYQNLGELVVQAGVLPLSSSFLTVSIASMFAEFTPVIVVAYF